MGALTLQEITTIGDEINLLSNEVKPDVIDNIDTNYRDILNIMQGIPKIEESCEIINRINNNARSLQKETVDVCNGIVNLINESLKTIN